ncbi:MAG: carboxymuconolactone decarboxylase family protein [Desulfobacterales bacterium]
MSLPESGRIERIFLILNQFVPNGTGDNNGDTYDALRGKVYKGGALSGKIKRLMALSGALIHDCRACIVSQTQHALNLGANVEEVPEACSVAISLGGTMAAGETLIN